MDRELLKIPEITPLNLPGDINKVLLMRFKQQENSSVGVFTWIIANAFTKNVIVVQTYRHITWQKNARVHYLGYKNTCKTSHSKWKDGNFRFQNKIS